MSRSQPVYQTFYLIEQIDPALASLERHRLGGAARRYLNVSGRWNARGSRPVPLLTWDSLDAAAVAARIACKSRDREIVAAKMSGFRLIAHHFTRYEDRFAPALEGPLSYATSRDQDLVDQGAKAIDCAAALLRLSGVGNLDAHRDLYRAESRGLMLVHRISLFSAAQYLTGSKAARVIDLLRSGALEPDRTKLSADELNQAVQLARSAAKWMRPHRQKWCPSPSSQAHPSQSDGEAPRLGVVP